MPPFLPPNDSIQPWPKAVGWSSLLDRLLVECVPSYCAINLHPRLADPDMQNEMSLEVVVVKICIEDEEECHVVRALADVPCCHDVHGFAELLGIIEMLLHEFGVDGIVPGFAALPAAVRISTSAFQQSSGDRGTLRIGEKTVVIPDQTRKQSIRKRRRETFGPSIAIAPEILSSVSASTSMRGPSRSNY